MKPAALSPLLLALLLAGNTHAGMFSDDEAHAKIVDLQKQNTQLQGKLDAMEKTSRNLHIDALAQIEAIKTEMSKLRGQMEEQSHAIETTQKRQRDLYVDTDTRLRQLEENAKAPPPPPVVPVVEDSKAAKSKKISSTKPNAAPEVVKPSEESPANEGKAYDEAFGQFKAGNYSGSLSSFQSFIQTWPKSPLAASAQYWIGNSHYNLKDYNAAISSQKILLSQYPKSPKVPDAMLNIATCQQNLGDGDAAKKSLEDLVAKYPLSDAGEKAKRRLDALK